MIAVLLKSPQGAPKTRLNTADRIGTGLSFSAPSPVLTPIRRIQGTPHCISQWIRPMRKPQYCLSKQGRTVAAFVQFPPNNAPISS